MYVRMGVKPMKRYIGAAMAIAIAASGISAVSPSNSLMPMTMAHAQSSPRTDARGQTIPADNSDVFVTTTIDKSFGYTKTGPRIYTLRQAEAAARGASIQGKIHNSNAHNIYLNQMHLETVDENGRLVKDGPSNHVY